jgi:fatty-acyl-CoA synthase
MSFTLGRSTNIFRNLKSDALFVQTVVRTFRKLAPIKPEARVSIADTFEEVVDRFGSNVALMDASSQMTYDAFDARANKVANLAQDQGIGRGDVVALMLENCIDYIVIWFGLQKVGATVSLINTNLTGKPLAHCINICECKHLIIGADFTDTLASIESQLEGAPKIWSTGGAIERAQDLDSAINAASDARPPASVRDGMIGTDRAFYIYTSGTTGNPKAAVISQARWLMAGLSFAGLGNAKPRDRLYLVLPLYHSTGGMAAVGSILTQGGSLFIKRKFSATDFWSDIRTHKLTRFQYVGELCRYLVNAPFHPDERTHGLELALGNGLRPDVWPEFQDRFAIPRVLEFYGATEGNISLFNVDGKRGAVGRIPKFASSLFKSTIVKFDTENEIPVRGLDGFCIKCDDDEPGEIIGLINPKDVRSNVEGYTDKKASDEKVLHNVFEDGDRWFRSGDLMRQDRDGYYYFVDRIGDTFRWKGENVSTAEVAEVISACPGIKEANVYGVKVDGADGRAGMASLVTSDAFSFEALLDQVSADLPQYARPIFVRLQGEMEITGTFKHRKVELVKDGFDPENVADPVFFLDPDLGRYVPLDKPLHTRILGGNFRF